MYVRRNWLLRCSILTNVVVILYIGSHLIGSHVTINGNSNFAAGPFAMHEQQHIVVADTTQHKMYTIPDNKTLGVMQPPLEGNEGAKSAIKTEKELLSQEAVVSMATDERTKHFGLVEPAAVAGPIADGSGTMANNNAANTEGYSGTIGEDKDMDARLRALLPCKDREYLPEIVQHGDFWVLKNYVRAGHGDVKCHTAITYTTHADYSYLDNLLPLLERWGGPISIALHAPGADFQSTIDAIKYLRGCLSQSELVRRHVTFHIYFSSKHMPKVIPQHGDVLVHGYNCSLPPPYVNVSVPHMYKTQMKLLYPVNVGRNIARDAALTHFVIAADIELYPSPGLIRKFMEMISRNDAYLQRSAPRVFVLPIFEVEASIPVPFDKTELQDVLRCGKAIPFHQRVCPVCHNIPKGKEWIAANETDELNVFHIGKRTGYFIHWEPVFIGTHGDPHYEERLSWEGKSDKMTQGYILCALNYEFHILDNAFLVHKPGIKNLTKDPLRSRLTSRTNMLIHNIIVPELKILYVTRKGCAV